MGADKVKELYNTANKKSINFIDFAREFNATIIPINNSDELPSDVLCRLIEYEQGVHVFYNKFAMRCGNRERFIVAWALTKYAITDAPLVEIHVSDTPTDQEMTTLFDILMPAKDLKEKLSHMIVPTVQDLSKIYSVPIEFVKQRLANIRLPIMIFGFNY